MNKLTINSIFFWILLFGLLNIILVLFNIQYFYLRAIFSFIFLTTIPGLLIMLILKIRNVDFWEYLIYVIGLSITFLLFSGLAVNYILPWLHITDKPLSLMPLLITLNIILSIFGIFAYIRNKDLSLEVRFPKLNWLNKIFFTFPIIFPILSILGAISLNNGGPNYFTMIMLGGIAIYAFMVILFHNKLNENVYPWSILTISLSLLLMLSLRSWYISGFDISKEYEVFQITKEKMLWSMTNFNDIYNACLSITILPTILSSFLHIRDEYIYKFFFQVLFSFVPVGIFILLNELKINKKLAFLSSLFYVSNPWFIDPMTTIGRQEIAFFSFILILLILFENKLTTISKWILLLLFSVSMVVSHYSTTYVALLIFIISYILLKLSNFIKRFAAEKFIITNFLGANTKTNIINGFYILFLLVSTFLWYFLITKSSSNVMDFTKYTIQNTQNILNKDMKNAIIDQLFSLNSNTMNIDAYKKYYVAQTAEYKKNKYLSLYDASSYKDFKIVPKTYPTLEIKNEKIFSIVNEVYKITLIFIELFLFAGTFYMIYKNSKKNVLLKKEYICLCLAGEILLMAMVILPYVSIGYNFDRLYMQIMFPLGLIEVLGGIAILNLLFKRHELSIQILTAFLIISFLYTYGFIWQLVGGKSVSWLNNFGYSYSQAYSYKTDVVSATWLSEIPGEPFIYATLPGRNILWAYGKKHNIYNGIFPSTIDRGAYIYLTYVNTIEKIVNFSYKGIFLGYEYPIRFLDNNKNEIYNNGQSIIYK